MSLPTLPWLATRLKLRHYSLLIELDRSRSVSRAAERLGLAFEEGAVTAAEARPVDDHPLLAGVRRLDMGDGPAVPLRLLEGSRGQVLAEAQDVPAAILADHGQGRVLALGDLALFVVARQESQNMRFWRNLAAYARGEGW